MKTPEKLLSKDEQIRILIKSIGLLQKEIQTDLDLQKFAEAAKNRKEMMRQKTVLFTRLKSGYEIEFISADEIKFIKKSRSDK